MNEHEEFGSQSGDTNLYRYAAGDPVNKIDPIGTGPVTGGVVCTALGLALTLKNVTQVFRDYNTLKANYDSAVANLKKSDCSEAEKLNQQQKLNQKLTDDTYKLLGNFLTPNVGQDIAAATICIAAYLAPGP